MVSMQKSDLILALKYRPKTFAELRGQEALVRVISNAIKRNRIYNAYLFTGIQGVGKTTTARLIAKTINCMDVRDQDGISVPCEVCKSCVEFANHQHPDVVELDGATQTGIDNIRELIESSVYKPMSAKYKVYIIDEVHMLSISAFNALLKTLEEPPSNVVFIFATTESKKIPSTIISRCQVFELKKLSTDVLVEHLQYVADAEKIRYDTSGLLAIADFSAGSARDALCALETVNMFKKESETINAELVVSALGLADIKCIYTCILSIIEGKPHEALESIAKMQESGTEAHTILNALLEKVAMISRMLAFGSTNLERLIDCELASVKNILELTDMANITAIWKMLLVGIEEMNISQNQMQVLDMVIIRICYLAEIPSVKDVMETNKIPAPTQSIEDILRGIPGAVIKNVVRA